MFGYVPLQLKEIPNIYFTFTNKLEDRFIFIFIFWNANAAKSLASILKLL